MIKNRLQLIKQELLKDFFKRYKPIQGGVLDHLFKKFSWHFLIATIIVFLSLAYEILPKILKEEPAPLSLDNLIPKDFVLVPIEIINGKDIINLIGKYGVVDLYAYSDQTQVPEKQVASTVKILPPDTEEGRFTALIPEKEASYLFEYSNPFYAVIQNPNKMNSKIYKKKKKKSLIVIEENF